MSIRMSKSRNSRLFVIFFFLAVYLIPQAAEAHAEGETLDNIAEVVSWIALIFAPLIGITLFLLVHIMPEKIAEKKNHPQAQAIKALCLLSLFFGGLLWPLAWLWAYSKPVLYKMAYGTDKGDFHEPTFKDLKASAEQNATNEE